MCAGTSPGRRTSPTRSGATTAIGARARPTSLAGTPLNPLLAVEVRGKNHGTLPEASSFLAVEQPNVECTTLKPAEANGSGFVLRFVETQGRQTAATISLAAAGPAGFGEGGEPGRG